MHFTASDITLYVPCYNPGGLLSGVLEGIGRQTAAAKRVFLVNDGSTEVLRAGATEIVSHATNRGLAAARNTALKACATSLIASLDADVVAEPTWLQGLLDALNETGASGVGGRLLEQEQTSPGDRWRAVHMAQNWGEKRVVNPRFLFGANTLFVVDALRRAGGYAPELRTNNEDRTLSDALFAMGHTLVYEPGAVCRHLRRDSCASVLRGYWKWHHAKGLVRGDFDSREGLLRRVGEVNFGIFRYRYDLDEHAGRGDLLPLDLALPWVFCHMDLEMFRLRTGHATSGLQQVIAAVAPPILQDFLRGAMTETSPLAVTDTWPAYMDEVAKQSERFGWTKSVHAAGIPWQVLG